MRKIKNEENVKDNKREDYILRIKNHPRLYDPIYIVNRQSKLAIEKFVRTASSIYKNKNMTLIDIGCGTKPYKKLFSTRTNYIGVDVVSNDPKDIISEAWNIPQKSNTADIVISTFSLEHIAMIEKTTKEITRLLKKKGLLFVIVPFVYPEHEAPNDFWRFSQYSIPFLFSDFHIIEKPPSNGYFLTLCVLNNLIFQAIIKVRFLDSVFFFVNNIFCLTLDFLIRRFLKFVKYEDCFYFSFPLSLVYTLQLKE